MYINPVVVGAVGILLAEMVVVAIAAVIMARKGKK